jgi:hypothetical protein
LKRKFKIFDNAIPFFSFPTQVEIVVPSCIIHNYDEFIIPEDEELPTITHQTSTHGQAMDHAFMVNFRQEIDNVMWKDREHYHRNNA